MTVASHEGKLERLSKRGKSDSRGAFIDSSRHHGKLFHLFVNFRRRLQTFIALLHPPPPTHTPEKEKKNIQCITHTFTALYYVTYWQSQCHVRLNHHLHFRLVASSQLPWLAESSSESCKQPGVCVCVTWINQRKKQMSGSSLRSCCIWCKYTCAGQQLSGWSLTFRTESHLSALFALNSAQRSWTGRSNTLQLIDPSTPYNIYRKIPRARNRFPPWHYCIRAKSRNKNKRHKIGKNMAVMRHYLCYIFPFWFFSLMTAFTYTLRIQNRFRE